MQHELEAVRHVAFAVDGGDRYHGCPTCMPPTATGRSGEDEGVVQLQLVEAEKRALDLIEVRGLVPFRHVLLARERKQVLVLGPEGERLPLSDGGTRERNTAAELTSARSKSGVSNRDAVTSCAETGT